MKQLEGMTVNPFSSEEDMPYSSKSQKIKKAECEIDDAMRRAFDAYSPDKMPEQYTESDFVALMPRQIDNLLSLLMVHYTKEEIEEGRTGQFLSKLMYKSHKAYKAHEFVFSTQDHAVSSLPYREGRFGNWNLYVNIDGDAGCYSGSGMCLGYLLINGCASDETGKNALMSRLFIRGNVGRYCGDSANYCDFEIFGDAEWYLGVSAHNSIFIVHGDIGQALFAVGDNNTLRTPNKSTFEKAIEYAMKGTKSRIQLIGDDGKVIKQVKL